MCSYSCFRAVSSFCPIPMEEHFRICPAFPFSDEPGEVMVVKNALIQHLEFDSKVTLGVLCDQIVPPDDPMEEEDRVIRERLRGLVVAFLAEDAREPLLARLRNQGDSGAEQERALIDTLLKVAFFQSFLFGGVLD